MTTWSRKIVAFLPNDRIQVRLGAGRLAQYDSAFNYIIVQEGGVDQVRILARYPFKVGDEWGYERKYGAMQGIEHGAAKVVSYESITVPAGTFSCYRIDTVANYGNKSYSEYYLWNRWYCPKVKWIAKERSETTIRDPNKPSRTTVTVSELLRFTPGD